MMIKMEKRNYIFCLFSGEFKGSGKNLNSRDKLDWVWFYDYSTLIGYIISELDGGELDKLRLEIYKRYKHYINFTRCSWFENSIQGSFCVDGYKVSSGIFKLPISFFASILPKKIRKKYFNYDNFYEKYILKPDFIYYLD